MSNYLLNDFEEKENKIKEKLYILFYELTSEIKEAKIEIDEEDYEENIKSTNIFQIIEYIYQSLQILLKKYKKEEIKIIKPKEYEINQYENSLKYLENKERYLIKKILKQKLIIESLEYKLEEYMEMEDEFEEMKTKYKYENGKFLDNDRKDNEIIIIRQENSNLKNIISNLEEDIKKKDQLIEDYVIKYENIQKKLEETEKELNLFSNIELNNNNENLKYNVNKKMPNNLFNLNIISMCNNNSNHNNSKNSSRLSKNNISEIKNTDMKIFNLKTSKNNIHKNKNIHGLFLNNKSLVSDISGKKMNNKQQNVSHYRNHSMNMVLEKKKIDLISKYLIFKNKNKINSNCNNSYIQKFKKKDFYNNLTTRYKKPNNHMCLRIIKKLPLYLINNGIITNRSLTNKNKCSNNNSTSINSKNHISNSKVMKGKKINNNSNLK